MRRPRVLVIYTGGTIGSLPVDRLNHASALDAAPFAESLDSEYCQGLEERMRQVGHGLDFDLCNIEPPIDSSAIRPDKWILLAKLIETEYQHYDGFLILHGTDTMAMTATALSFMFETLDKPIVLTGSQVPLFQSPTDARSNLLHSLWVASQTEEATLIPEVVIVFGRYVVRGCQAVKVDASDGDAFRAPNGVPLGVVRPEKVHIYKDRVLEPRPVDETPSVLYRMYSQGSPPDCVYEKQVDARSAADMTGTRVFNIRPTWDRTAPPFKIRKVELDPDDDLESTQSQLADPLVRGVLLATYGVGNAPPDPGLHACLREATERDCLIVNVSRCSKARVAMGQYAASSLLLEHGVVSGMDMTHEAARTKIRWAAAKHTLLSDMQKAMQVSQRGEQGEDLHDLRFGGSDRAEDRTGDDASWLARGFYSTTLPQSLKKQLLKRCVIRFSDLALRAPGVGQALLHVFLSNPNATIEDAGDADITIDAESIAGDGGVFVHEIPKALVQQAGDTIQIRLVASAGASVAFNGLFLALFAEPSRGTSTG